MNKTYRVTFLHELDNNTDYWGNGKQAESNIKFHEIHDKYYDYIFDIKQYAYRCGVTAIFHFYEPHVELTWSSTEESAKLIYNHIQYIVQENNLGEVSELKTGDEYLDWFCCSDEEREFGGKRHVLCSELVELFHLYKNDIKQGKGVHAQVGRTIHTICNPLGINYWDEAKICFSRGLICVLFRFFSFGWAVWIYRNIFRLKY